MTEELKPCPFCGGKAEIYSICDGISFIGCKTEKCYLSIKQQRIGMYSVEKQMISAWNRRADHES